MLSRSHSLRSNQDQGLSSTDFRALGLRDLLDARDQFHVHLAHKSNVFATAVGLYLIRDTDPDANSPLPSAHHRRHQEAAKRTLTNSSVREWSWPCLLVFVTEWQSLHQLRNRPDQVVPPCVYLPDGRVVPICVVAVEGSTAPPRVFNPAQFHAEDLGIGSPLFVDAQGTRRIGTVNCLVSDGSDFYVLTNTHLAGQQGRPVGALLNDGPQLVGTTLGTGKLTEKTFSDVYPELPSRDSVVNIDAAMVRLNDASIWNARKHRAYVGPVADFSADTASLKWIGKPVVGYGAASGKMEGEIKALFYRYKSIGGRDYIADLVLGSRSGDPVPLVTQPGDSGALWCLDRVVAPHTLSPVAMEWGGQRIADGPGTGQYLELALATSMAVTLRELSLDIVPDPAAERTQYWGPVGHYKIGQQACELVRDSALKKFFQANINIISFAVDNVGTETTLKAASGFIPLSDVPDVVWKTNINRSAPKLARAMENWNHYADIDMPGSDGSTLMQMYQKDPSSLDVQSWITFYQGAPVPSASTKKSNDLGALPFRVWQIFEQMVSFAKGGSFAEFLTACGVVAHYVGDACQPLHSSQHSDGLNGASTGVHSTYEDNMVNAKTGEIATGLVSALKISSFKPRAIRSSRDAACAVMDLMIYAQTTLAPETICKTYNQVRPATSATTNPQVIDALWKVCKPGTIDVIAAGAIALGAIWQAAWNLSGASTSKLPSTAFDGTKDIEPIYEALDFLPSLHMPYFSQKDLPGSDAPKTPPPMPSNKASTKKAPTKKSPAKKKPAKKAVKTATKRAAAPVAAKRATAAKKTAKKATKKPAKK